MKSTTKILILVWMGITLILLGGLIKRTIVIENKIDDLKILNELRGPVELKAVEITPELYDIVKCESQWKHEGIYGDNGRAYGYAQFWEETFYWLAGLAGEDLDYYNPNDQLWLLDWSLKNGRAYLWTCARNLGVK